MRLHLCFLALLGVLFASPALAAWVGGSTSTTETKEVSPYEDIVGFVGHLSNSVYQSTSSARGHEGCYDSSNSGQSVGPAPSHNNQGTASNLITVKWNSQNAEDGERSSGGWAVGRKFYGSGQSQVTAGATYSGTYTQVISSIVLTVQTPTGPVEQGDSSLGFEEENYSVETLSGNDSFNTEEPSTWTMVLTNMTSPTEGDFFTAYPGTGSPSTPSVKLEVDFDSSIYHAWSHPPGAPSTATVDADWYMKIRAIVFFL